MDFQELKELIKTNLKDAEIEVTDLTGTQDHLGITVISDAFKGKMLLQQHQMIMDILKEKLKSEIHAVKIKTMTKEQALKHTL
jgi:stress-induced morphogen